MTESGPAARRLTSVEEQLRLLYFYLRDSCFTYLNGTLSEVKDRAPWLSQNPVSSQSQPSHTNIQGAVMINMDGCFLFHVHSLLLVSVPFLNHL